MTKNYDFTAQEMQWIQDAKAKNATLVFPESEFSNRVTEAGEYIAKNGIANVVFLGKSDEYVAKYNSSSIRAVNILNSELRDMLASCLYNKRKEKGMTIEEANKTINDPVYFATMMVEMSLVDGMVAGAEIATSATFKPALQVIKARPNGRVSSFFAMLRGDEKYLLADCGLNIDPSAEEIASFAIDTANSYRLLFHAEPRVALLSYSTYGSAGGDSAHKMIDAVNILKNSNVDFVFDGEMQLDSAVVPEVAKLKCPSSPIAGHANVFIFPDLASGNIGYKLMQRFGGFKAFGPIAQGFNKPVNDVSRGCTASDVVMAGVITILQI